MTQASTRRPVAARINAALLAAGSSALWILIPIAVLAIGVILKDAGASKGQSLIASYAALLALTAIVVKLLSKVDQAYRSRNTQVRDARTHSTPAEVAFVLCALLAMIAIIVWFLIGDTCDTGLYVCG